MPQVSGQPRGKVAVVALMGALVAGCLGVQEADGEPVTGDAPPIDGPSAATLETATFALG